VSVAKSRDGQRPVPERRTPRRPRRDPAPLGRLPTVAATEAPGGDVAAGLRRAVAAAPSPPLPGGGHTFERMEVLAAVAAQDLSVGRLYEGHTDALAILAEAGRDPRPASALYGVWAARSPEDPTTASRSGAGWVLSGTKQFCSGVGIIERALVTAEAEDGYRLFDVDLAGAGIAAVEGSWPAVGMVGSASLTVTFDAVPVDADRTVGGPDFYTGRPGFWFGAAGVAACWYGGAVGLVEHLLDGLAAAPAEHVLTEVGRAVARVGSMRHSLEGVAAGGRPGPAAVGDRARDSALEVRDTVHAACTAVLAHVANAGGARPLGHDPAQARRAADLYVYLSQHHGPADSAQLGRLAHEQGLRWT
jgi:alkylation response protein AidB-like acyl-CoA dehydrogenase